MQLLTAFGLLMVLWTVSATTQKQDWANVQYSEPTLDDKMSTHHNPIMRALGKDQHGRIKSLVSTFQLFVRERYGAECSNGVMQAILAADDCIKPAVDPDNLQTINMANIMQKVMTGKFASTFCPLIDFESVLICIQDLETSVKLACAGDKLISNVVRIIDAEARVVRRLCRDGGKLVDDGIREVVTCRGNNQWLMNSAFQTCSAHNQRILIDQGIDKRLGVNGILKVLENTSKICSVMSESASCVPAALEHCSPLFAKLTTEASNDVLSKVCGSEVGNTLDGLTARELVDEYGGLYTPASGCDGVQTTAVLLPLLVGLVWLS